MKKSRGILAIVAAATMLFSLTPIALAGSAGACGSSGTDHFVYGNFKSGGEAPGITGVQADLYIPGPPYFTFCVPNDHSGVNEPSVLIELENGTFPYIWGSWVQAGIARCNNSSDSFCDGTPHLISEWQEGQTGFNTIRDLGPAAYNTTYHFQITVCCSGNQSVVVRVNGVDKTIWATGDALTPDKNPNGYWFTETHDRGDGLGSNSSGLSTGISNMQYNRGGPLYNRTGGCNDNNSGGETNCAANGPYGMYFWTVN